MCVPLIQTGQCANKMVSNSVCKKSHLERNGESRASCARKGPLHPREGLVVWRIRLSAPVLYDKVIKDRAKVNGYSAAVIPHSHPLQ